MEMGIFFDCRRRCKWTPHKSAWDFSSLNDVASSSVSATNQMQLTNLCSNTQATMKQSTILEFCVVSNLKNYLKQTKAYHGGSTPCAHPLGKDQFDKGVYAKCTQQKACVFYAEPWNAVCGCKKTKRQRGLRIFVDSHSASKGLRFLLPIWALLMLQWSVVGLQRLGRSRALAAFYAGRKVSLDSSKERGGKTRGQ